MPSSRAVGDGDGAPKRTWRRIKKWRMRWRWRWKFYFRRRNWNWVREKNGTYNNSLAWAGHRYLEYFLRRIKFKWNQKTINMRFWHSNIKNIFIPKYLISNRNEFRFFVSIFKCFFLVFNLICLEGRKLSNTKLLLDW